MALNQEEKRCFPRIKLKTQLKYKVRGVPECNSAVSDDISLGGIGFINHCFVVPQTHVGLEINILSKIITPIGRIAWSHPLSHSDRYRVGIEFLEFDPREKNFLAEYIDMQRGRL